MLSPFAGKTMDITEVKDPVFSQGMLGDGCAILPDSGDIYAPVGGEISVIADTLHSVCIRTPQGLELIIHYGIDTVKYKGTGFEMNVKVGQKIRTGELLYRCDREYFLNHGVDMTSPVVIANGEKFIIKKKCLHKNVLPGDVIMKLKLRQ